jgi:hypothetical protein
MSTPVALHSAVRLVMRKLIAYYSVTRAQVQSTINERSIPSAMEDSKRQDQLLADDVLAATPGSTIIVNIDVVLDLIIRYSLTRISFVNTRLREIYDEGDSNGDGTLSFAEFTSIIGRVAEHFPRRRILRMFREALQAGLSDNNCIDRDTFVNICQKHGVVQLVNIQAIKTGNAILRSLYISLL